jgi:hypothetical protein
MRTEREMHPRRPAIKASEPQKYPPIGSKWKELDLRVERTVEVIRYDVSKGRVRINCIETQRLGWAKPERFNGKSGGYAPLQYQSPGQRQRGARAMTGRPKNGSSA